MCTKIIKPSKRKFGYKIINHIGNKKYNSIFRPNYYWMKGTRQALYYDSYHKTFSTESRVIPDDMVVGAGYFHCFSILRSIKSCVKKMSKLYPKDDYRIIRVALSGNVYDGVHIKFDEDYDGKPSVVATEVTWDGKFVK